MLRRALRGARSAGRWRVRSLGHAVKSRLAAGAAHAEFGMGVHRAATVHWTFGRGSPLLRTVLGSHPRHRPSKAPPRQRAGAAVPRRADRDVRGRPLEQDAERGGERYPAQGPRGRAKVAAGGHVWPARTRREYPPGGGPSPRRIRRGRSPVCDGPPDRRSRFTPVGSDAALPLRNPASRSGPAHAIPGMGVRRAAKVHWTFGRGSPMPQRSSRAIRTTGLQPVWRASGPEQVVPPGGTHREARDSTSPCASLRADLLRAAAAARRARARRRRPSPRTAGCCRRSR
jgi:hypothetical protein